MLNVHQILTLLNLKGVGRGTALALINSIDDKPSTRTELYELLKDLEINFPRFRIGDKYSFEEAFNKAEQTLEISYENNIKVSGITDSSFPIRLKKIPDPPVVFFVKGNEEALNLDLSVAIIGTREPSPYGEKCAERFADYFAKRNIGVVSGLAAGIDTAGHKGCLNAGGYTVAVLAQGLNTPVYPAKNRQLAERILEKNGCIVSEYPPNLKPRNNLFVERDRLQAGLSAGVIVIETDIKGGTMHTVKFCEQQKKPLGCLDHPEKFQTNNPKANGNRYLIKENKAVPLFEPKEMEYFISKMIKTNELVIEKKKIEKNNRFDVQISFDIEN